jgi:fatty-acid peroxygenase
MKAAAGFLSRELHYEVPEQKLDIEFSKLPALPKSRFLMRNISQIVWKDPAG